MQGTIITIQPGSLQGEILAPPSKSVMQRICAAIWVKGGKMGITNPGHSADDHVMIALLKKAGCSIDMDEQGRMLIHALKANKHKLNAAHFGESGLATRMCIPVLALAGHHVQLLADESLSKRPMHFFENALPQLGVSFSTKNGCLPAAISGSLVPRNITVDGSVSSQFITGLLLAYAGADARDVTISVNDPVSSPYIALTLDVMQAAGLKVPVQQASNFYFDDSEAPQTEHEIVEFTVEGDWSNAAFWLVAGAVAGPVTVKGLDVFSAQADKAVLTALMDCGAVMSIESAQITVSPAPLHGFHFNAKDCPDLFPPLAVLACYAEGTSVIEGIGRLRHKESNRAETISVELGKMGADISLQDEYMIIRGGTALHGATVSSHNDHRIAMMCTIAALGADAPITIGDASAIVKSYPRFFDDLKKLGGSAVSRE